MLYLQKDSKFNHAYSKGVDKRTLWDYAFEDSLDLLAKIGPAAAYIYRHKYFDDEFIRSDTTLDYGANFS